MENLGDDVDNFFRDHCVVEMDFAFRTKLDCAGNESEQCVVFTYTNIMSWHDVSTALADNNRAGLSFVAFRNLDSEIFWSGITTVFSCSRGFFMCHVGL